MTADAKSSAAKKPAVQNKGGRKRLSDKQRKNRLAKYHALVAAGEPALKAAKKVGVSYVTLLNWEKKTGARKPAGKAAAGKGKRKAARAGGKAVKKTARAGGLAIVTPEGVRIEGLSTADLVRVLKALK